MIEEWVCWSWYEKEILLIFTQRDFWVWEDRSEMWMLVYLRRRGDPYLRGIFVPSS